MFRYDSRPPPSLRDSYLPPARDYPPPSSSRYSPPLTREAYVPIATRDYPPIPDRYPSRFVLRLLHFILSSCLVIQSSKLMGFFNNCSRYDMPPPSRYDDPPPRRSYDELPPRYGKCHLPPPIRSQTSLTILGRGYEYG